MSATDGALPGDVYGNKAEGVYTPNVGVVAAQGGPVSSDNQSPAQVSAPAVVALSPTAAIPTPADGTALAGTMPSVRMEQSGTGVASPVRTVSSFVQVKAVAVTAGTPVSVLAPTTGKKFRLLSYHLSLSVAGSILFEDTTGVEVLRTPLLAAGVGQGSPPMGNGYLSTAANNQLFLDVTASGSVSGWIGIIQE